jgi:hypothetical protein
MPLDFNHGLWIRDGDGDGDGIRMNKSMRLAVLARLQSMGITRPSPGVRFHRLKKAWLSFLRLFPGSILGTKEIRFPDEHGLSVLEDCRGCWLCHSKTSLSAPI